jgi:hypothetical protein
MRQPKPALTTTRVGPNGHAWFPEDFQAFQTELDRLEQGYPNSLLLFRGHSESAWVLDSLFARKFKNEVFGFKSGEIPSQRVLESVSFALAIHNAFHFKFGVYSAPSQELLDLEGKEPTIDPSTSPLFPVARAFRVRSHSFKEIGREEAIFRGTDHRLSAGG